MSQKYNITDEEINQTILHSPYALADAPSKAGLKAVQIKKYFYEFIRFFAGKINLHLSDIDVALENFEGELSQKIEDLEKMDSDLGTSIESLIATHNVGEGSHADIREKIGADITSHNTSTVSHQDLRAYLKELRDKLNATYALASGKSKVFPCQSVLDALEQIYEKKDIAVGDLFLIADENEVDFTVFELAYKNPNDIEISYEEIANGEMTLEPGNVYYFAGVRLLATRGNLETGLLAKQEALDELELTTLESLEELNTKLNEIDKTLALKQDKLTLAYSTAESVALSTDHEYNLGQRTSLALVLESVPSGFEAIVSFHSAKTPTSFDAPSELYFTGDDTLDGRLYPVSNRLYEINIKDVQGVLVARVGACDYEVIE